MDSGTITTLPSLETLSMAFNFKEIRDHNHPILSLLEFPNITKISINVFMFDSDGFVSDGSEDDLDLYAWSHVCCPLRGQSQYPKL